MLGRDHDLVEIHGLGIDGDEAHHGAADFRDRDLRDRHQFLAPALAPPGDARVEIEMRIVLRPGAPPQLDRRVLVGGLVLRLVVVPQRPGVTAEGAAARVLTARSA